MNSDYCIELDGWGDNQDLLDEEKYYGHYDEYDEEEAYIRMATTATTATSATTATTAKKIHNAAKKKEQKAQRALKAQERALKTQVQATGQALLIQGPYKPVVVAPTGSVLTSHNTVLSPDGWETVVPRGTVLDQKHR